MFRHISPCYLFGIIYSLFSVLNLYVIIRSLFLEVNPQVSQLYTVLPRTNFPFRLHYLALRKFSTPPVGRIVELLLSTIFCLCLFSLALRKFSSPPCGRIVELLLSTIFCLWQKMVAQPGFGASAFAELRLRSATRLLTAGLRLTAFSSRWSAQSPFES